MLIRPPGRDTVQMVRVTGFYGDQLKCASSSCHETLCYVSKYPANPRGSWRGICNRNKDTESGRRHGACPALTPRLFPAQTVCARLPSGSRARLQ